MSTRRKVLEPPFVETYAEVIERGVVCIEPFTPRPVYRNKLRYEVDYLAELCFLLPDLFFRNLTFGDVGYRPNKLAIARGILQNVSYGEDVLDSPTRE